MELTERIVGISQGIATVIAIAVGGIWGYLLFIRRRQIYPRANLTHRITHYPITDGKILIHLDVTIANVGDVLLQLVYGEVRIQQILPVPSQVLDSIDQGLEPVEEGHTEVNWPQIGSRKIEWARNQFEIEPGETDDINYDFIIESDVTTVELYTYFRNIRKRGREIGWNYTTIHSLGARVEQETTYINRHLINPILGDHDEAPAS